MASATGPRRGISVRWLLLVVNALVVVLPVLTFVSLRLFRTHQIRQTEKKLIAESVLIGEAYRDLLLQELKLPADETGDIRPPGATDERFAPIDPVLDSESEIHSRVEHPDNWATDRRGPAWRAGERLEPLLRRAQVFNLTSARVLDTHGCVVATSGTWRGACLAHLPEVAAALAGRYDARARQRISDEPKPAYSSISRRDDVRVFTATPVFSRGEVTGVVWMSRTAMDPLKAAWTSRRPLLTALLFSIALALVVTLVFSKRITRPLREITQAAAATARGESAALLPPGGAVPAEIHALGTALATMRNQLADRAAYISDFATNVSHELKSPITSIRGAAELLREEAGSMPEAQRVKFLGNIEADAARMERLVTRLLELARIQNAPAASETVEVAPFLERIAAALSDRIRVDCTAAPATVEAHPDHLESAVRNLLDNALRHGADKPVELIAAAHDGRLSIRVCDHGPGISRANQQRIFERFFTTDRDSGGTGLGLAIVQAVANAHGGEVSFVTGPDGSTFTLGL